MPPTEGLPSSDDVLKKLQQGEPLTENDVAALKRIGLHGFRATAETQLTTQFNVHTTLTDPDKTKDAALEKAEAFDSLIDRTELAMDTLHQRLLALPPSSPTRVAAAEQYAPFAFSAINRAENAERNMAKLRYWSHHGGANSVTMGPRRFYYDYLETDGPAILSFDPRSRRVQIPDFFDPSRDVDLLFLYHEIWHALQDNWLRMHYPDRYDELTEEGTVVVDFEYDAYAHMFEQMDRLLAGALRRIAPSTFPSKNDCDHLCVSLGVPEALGSRMRDLFYLAGCYFDASWRGPEQYPATFRNTIDRFFTSQRKKTVRLV